MVIELTALPDQFSAGTTVPYQKRFADYPASAGWTLTLYLAGASVLDATAVADGDDFVVTLDAADTADLLPGLYKWVERVTSAEEAPEVYDVASGTVTVTPDLSAATAGSQQEWLERAIAALKAHIEGRLPAGMESYQIAGRMVSKMPVKDAMGLLATLESRLARVANPGCVTRSVLVSFTPTGFDE